MRVKYINVAFSPYHSRWVAGSSNVVDRVVLYLTLAYDYKDDVIWRVPHFTNHSGFDPRVIGRWTNI